MTGQLKRGLAGVRMAKARELSDPLHSSFSADGRLHSIMRSLSSAKEAWEELKHYQSLHELRIAIRLDGPSSIATAGCRSACWRAFLLFDTLDMSTWPRTLSSSRSAYDSLRAHFRRHLDNEDELAASFDPLAEQNEVSSPRVNTCRVSV